MSARSDPYGFKMVLFDNGEPEEFLLFVNNFNMIVEVSVTFVYGMRIKYLHTLV